MLLSVFFFLLLLQGFSGSGHIRANLVFIKLLDVTNFDQSEKAEQKKTIFPQAFEVPMPHGPNLESSCTPELLAFSVILEISELLRYKM